MVPKRKVLIADSDVLRVVEVEEILKNAGYETDYTFSSRNIFSKMDYWQPDVLLFDIRDEACDYNTILTKLRNEAAFEDVVVVLVSHMPSEKMQQICLDTGANGYFSKDVDIQVAPDYLANFFE